MNRTEKITWAAIALLASLAVFGTAFATGKHGGGSHGGGGTSGGSGAASGASAGGSGGSSSGASVGAGGGGVSSGGGPTGGGATGDGSSLIQTRASNRDRREQMHADARECDPFGDITVRSKQDGSFTYGGLEFHLPTFVSCMRAKGYALSGAAREDLTNFGTR